MKKILLLISTALNLFALNAWADNDVVIVVNSKVNKIEKLSQKELQDFYSGEASKYRETKVKAKLCINTNSKEDFFNKIDLSENQATANKSKLLATGKADNVITPKPLETKDVIEYISRNPDGGLCFLSRKDFDALAKADKDTLRIVYGNK